MAKRLRQRGQPPARAVGSPGLFDADPSLTDVVKRVQTLEAEVQHDIDWSNEMHSVAENHSDCINRLSANMKEMANELRSMKSKCGVLEASVVENDRA